MAKNFSKIDLSIIVPVFNEEDGIEKTIIEIFKDAKSTQIRKLISSFEIIVVDDGSFDKTSEILKNLQKKYKNLKVINHKINRGLGAAIVTGVKCATKSFITYLPADGQAFLREIHKGLEIVPNADLVLTFRGQRRDYNMYRHMLSSVLMISMKIFFNLNFKDYNWVHIYRKNALQTIKTKSNGVFYLGEVTARMHDKGFKILEAQASYNPRFGGVSKNAKLSVALQTLKDLIKLWWELRVSS